MCLFGILANSGKNTEIRFASGLLCFLYELEADIRTANVWYDIGELFIGFSY